MSLRAMQAEESWRRSDDPLSLSMRAIATQLDGAGLKPAQEMFRGFLDRGRTRHASARAARASCLTLIALASRGVHDMDAALYSPDGDLLAIDSQPDAHPTIQVCTGDEPHTLYYALQVYEGAGSFLDGSLRGPTGDARRSLKLLGARPAVARLGYTRAGRAGTRLGVPRRPAAPRLSAGAIAAAVPLAADQRVRVRRSWSSLAQCYTAAGFALDGLRDLNLRVLDDEGARSRATRREEQDASAQFCADRHAEFAAELDGAAGEGDGAVVAVPSRRIFDRRAERTVARRTSAGGNLEAPLARGDRGCHASARRARRLSTDAHTAPRTARARRGREQSLTLPARAARASTPSADRACARSKSSHRRERAPTRASRGRARNRVRPHAAARTRAS